MGRTRYQEGSLRLESRKRGKVWRLRFRITRADGNRVEHAIVIGTQKELPTRATAREFVKSLYLPINHPAPNNNGRPVTFSDIAGHYIQEELTEDQNQASAPKAYSTTATYRRYLRKWILPRWGDQAALMIAPLDLENWLKELGRKSGLENQTRSKIRQVIGLVYKHAQRVGFLPRTEQANPIRFVRQSTASNFDPIILTPAQAFAIINQLGLMLRTLVLVTAATALRISEILALQEGHRRRESMHLRPASLRLWEIRETQVEGVKASRSAPSSTRGTSAQLAPGNAIQEGRGPRVPLVQAKGHEATASQHAFVRSSSACGHEGGGRSPAQGIWVPHFPANAGVGLSRQQQRSKTRAGTTPSFEHQNHPGRLCPSHYTGQAGGTGSLPEPATQRFMDGEGTSNELRCLAQTPHFVGILWASSNGGIPNNCFEMWWPGTELNRRRQPFQGCALPPELPGHVSKPALRAAGREDCSLHAGCRRDGCNRSDAGSVRNVFDYSNARGFPQCLCGMRWWLNLNRKVFERSKSELSLKGQSD